jgi:hypothetical protein
VLLEELFSGPLRAIRDFYDFFERNPDALAAEIEAALKRKKRFESDDERKAFARKAAASLLQLVSFGFLLRAAQSANSESLKEDVNSVVERVNTPAFRLIELGIHLDSPKPLPRRMLEKLFKEVSKELVPRRVIHLMVLNRLYMFKTSERDMQWLSQELKIDLDVQHAITYQDKHQRVLR